MSGQRLPAEKQLDDRRGCVRSGDKLA